MDTLLIIQNSGYTVPSPARAHQTMMVDALCTVSTLEAAVFTSFDPFYW